MALLLLHSHWSLLTGPCAVRRLCEETVRRGHAHAALTDVDGLYGFLPFARQCARVGLQALYGVDLRAGARLVALAQNEAGYRSLCRLVSARHLRADFDLVYDAAENAEGLVFLGDDPRLLAALAGRLPAGSLYALWPGGGDPRLAEVAQALGLPRAAAHDVWFVERNDHDAHRLFVAVRENGAFGAELPYAPPSACLPDVGALRAAFADAEDAWRNAQQIASQATLVLGEKRPPVFPDYAPPDRSAPADWLRRLARAGLRRRMPAAGPQAAQRLEGELAVIERMGFAPYFLVVHEIAELARARGIPLLGRGSAADSLVSFALGLTDADPLRYGLLFERFLNPARGDLPDIDLDFCWRRRDEVLAAVYERFGAEHVAMIATYNTCGPRAAYREAAKALGLPPDEIDRRTALLPGHWHEAQRFAELVAETPGLSRPHAAVAATREALLLRCADLLLAAPRHLGIHPGGIVITPGPIRDHAPLTRASKGLVITQYDMHAVEALGLVKIDLLGNRALSIVADARAALRARGIGTPELAALPEDDARTAALLRAGRTLACFQTESPGMRTLLRQLRAGTMDHVIQAIALIRPGPAAGGMKERFVRRARGLEPVDYPHPLLEPVLQDTFGVLLYQEDVIRAAIAIAGMDGADGDQLRRDLGRVRGGDPAQRDRFVVAGLKRGVPAAVVGDVWDAMARFAAFSFCKAHAVTYGRLAYQCAWLKAHHPAAFLAAMLSNDAGYYEQGVYVEEAKRLGVRMLAPCVLRADPLRYVLEPDGGPVAIRVPLAAVHGLSARTRDAIAGARDAGGPFRSLVDFVQRTDAARDEAENLVLCGGLDALGLTRPQLLLALHGLRAPRGPAPGLLAPPVEPALPPLPEYSAERRAALELQILGFTLERHPLEVLWGEGPRGTMPCGEAEQHVGRAVMARGWVVAQRRLRTQDGRPMLFLTLEDGTGILEVTLFPDVYPRLAAELSGRGPYVVHGRIESQDGGISLRAARIGR
jgi:DNA-directed DNA polymerase III PolC